MGRHEVTWNEYELFMFPEDEKKKRVAHKSEPSLHAVADAVSRPTTPYVEMSFGMGINGFPAISMTQHAANKYAEWLSAKTGKRYRLPTEAEWEKAARGTDGRRYPFGESIDRSQANFVGAQTFDTVMPAGHYSGSPSPYGAFDMAGNVLEWCQDWYDRDYYSVSPRKNPKGPATGAYRVVRGGSFFVEEFDLRTTARSMASPSFQAHRMIGFRPVREP